MSDEGAGSSQVCVVCGVWCVVCGVWCVVCGVWCGVVRCEGVEDLARVPRQQAPVSCGGLVFEAHALLYDSSLCSRVIDKTGTRFLFGSDSLRALGIVFALGSEVWAFVLSAWGLSCE